MELGLGLLFVAVVLFGVAFINRKNLNERSENKPTKRGKQTQTPVPIAAPRPRPPVVEFHVHDDEARVFFGVVAPSEPDDVLNELLVGEAIEVVREKSHSLPISHVHHVVAFAKTTDGPVEMGRATLDQPGVLPVRPEIGSILNLGSIAADPLAGRFGEVSASVPQTVVPVKSDTLPHISKELRLPRAVSVGLRAQGIDPETMTAGSMLVGMLRLVGYLVEPGPVPRTHVASKDGLRTFIRQDDFNEGDHPEVTIEALDRFAFEFQASQTDRALYVSDKFGPFEVYDRERRDPRVRFLTRERLQSLIDGLAVS